MKFPQLCLSLLEHSSPEDRSPPRIIRCMAGEDVSTSGTIGLPVTILSTLLMRERVLQRVQVHTHPAPRPAPKSLSTELFTTVGRREVVPLPCANVLWRHRTGRIVVVHALVGVRDRLRVRRTHPHLQ